MATAPAREEPAPPLATPPPQPAEPPAPPQQLSDELLAEIRRLADRVGGLDKLRDLVTTLAAVGH